jgi:hypothetical protein
MSIRSSGEIAINGSIISLNGSSTAPNITNPPTLQKYSLPEVKSESNGPAIQYSLDPNKKIVSINYKVPTHEPYLRRNSTQNLEEVNEVSSTLSTDINGDPINPTGINNPLGPKSAANTVLTDAAPTSFYIQQPESEGSIGELTTNDVRALTAQIAYTESRGDYKFQSDEYIGKYQFSVDDLTKLGYIKEGLEQSSATINNPNNWVNKDGIKNMQDFLASAELQEQAMFNLMKNNYASLQATGAIGKDTSKEVISGLLSVSHLTGPDNASAWYKTGKYNKNSNSSEAENYYNRGKFSSTQTNVYDNNS